MKQTLTSVFLFQLLLFGLNCTTDNGFESDGRKLAQGSWHGSFGSGEVVFTLIESRFENSIPVTGTAYIMSDSLASAYLIMNGNRNDKTLVFSLYPIPVRGKENYHIHGQIINSIFQGSFDQLDSTGAVIYTGDFSTERIP